MEESLRKKYTLYRQNPKLQRLKVLFTKYTIFQDVNTFKWELAFKSKATMSQEVYIFECWEIQINSENCCAYLKAANKSCVS